MPDFAKSRYTFNFESIQLQLSIVKTFTHFHRGHCITNTIYIYKKLLSLKNRLMKAKIIKTFTLLPAGFKKTKISKRLNLSKMTIHQVEQRLKAS